MNATNYGVLVVDDEPLVRLLLERSLTLHGFSVWLASNGQEAIDSYCRHQWHIAMVFLDVNMPGLDGPETACALRAIDPQVRFCFITGCSVGYSEAELLALGALRVFPKPFVIAELVRAVQDTVLPDKAQRSTATRRVGPPTQPWGPVGAGLRDD
jgi:CheY-like chemotaxis protein